MLTRLSAYESKEIWFVLNALVPVMALLIRVLTSDISLSLRLSAMKSQQSPVNLRDVDGHTAPGHRIRLNSAPGNEWGPVG